MGRAYLDLPFGPVCGATQGRVVPLRHAGTHLRGLPGVAPRTPRLEAGEYDDRVTRAFWHDAAPVLLPAQQHMLLRLCLVSW